MDTGLRQSVFMNDDSHSSATLRVQTYKAMQMMIHFQGRDITAVKQSELLRRIDVELTELLCGYVDE